jgi:hypothetical protein
LIGNSFSIPTLEFILGPIKPLFAEQDYPELFSYKFAWEQPGVNLTHPEVSKRVNELTIQERIQQDAAERREESMAIPAAAAAQTTQEAGDDSSSLFSKDSEEVDSYDV